MQDLTRRDSGLPGRPTVFAGGMVTGLAVMVLFPHILLWAIIACAVYGAYKVMT